MKSICTLIPALVVAGSALGEMSVDGELPAGNVIVDGVAGDVVRLRQDMRDSNNWFYWAFRVKGAEGRTVRFDFTDRYAGGPVSCRGPAVTRDGGKTWAYAAEGHSTPSNFVYTFAKDERETWFYQTFQYYPHQWDEFLKRHEADRGKFFEAGVLCKSRKGRDVPKAVFGRIDGKAKYRVWLSSRTHCGEAPATYVIEGWLERVFGKDDLGAWLRENVEFMVVPFVDYDGVVDGDQGKGRKPHDHNRDYVAFLYPESRAIADWITQRTKGDVDIFLDCHSPWVRNQYNEKMYQTYHSDEWNTAAKIRWGRLLEKHQTGSMNYSVSGDFPWGFGWNGPKNTAPAKPGDQRLLGIGGWAGENLHKLLMNSTYEVPFANAAGKTVTPQSCREIGAASAAVLRDFLSEMRPVVRENVVYREDFDRFGNFTACFNAGAGLMEEKNGVLALKFEPKAASDFRSGYFKVDVPPRAANWKFSFDFAFATDTPRTFDIKLAFGNPERPVWRTLTVCEEGSFFAGHDAPAPRDGMSGFLPKGVHNWNKGAIVVSGATAAFWTYRNGVLVKECETAFPALPLVGWNFGIPCRTGGEVRLDRVVVTDATERPYDRGDPTEWLAQSRVPTADQWDDYWGVSVDQKHPIPVDFAKQKSEIHFRSSFAINDKGRADSVTIFYNCETGTPLRIAFSPTDEEVRLTKRVFGNGTFTNAELKVGLPAEKLSVSGVGTMPRACVYARPPMRARLRYLPRELAEIYAARDRLETLKDKTFVLETVAVSTNRYRVFLNHQVISEFDAPAKIVSVGVGGKDVEAHAWSPAAPKEPDPQVYRLPLPPGGFALERVRENQGTYALECNGYLSRDALEAMPSSCLFNVPKRQWVRAKALCGVDPTAPANAIPVVTARLTQFYANGGRSLAMCQKTVDLRTDPACVVKKGDLYEITFDLDIGQLQDLVFMDDGMARRPLSYLHFEFTGPVWEKARYYMDNGRSPAESEVSSLVVYGGSLEASPVDFTAMANRKFSLYYPDEKAGATLRLAPRVPGAYAVEAKLCDEDGTWTGESFVLPARQLAGPVEIPVEWEAKPYGWYEVSYTVKDAQGRPLVTHEASFVRIRPNTRKAGLASPYYSWNFRGAHGTPNVFDDWAVAYTRLGIPRTTLLGAFTGGTNKKLREDSPECVKYGFTQVQFPHLRGAKGEVHDAAAFEKAVAERKALVETFPHCRTALIFHESGNGPFPKEVYGGVTEVDDAVRAADSNKVAAALWSAKAWRAADPTVKLIHGNSSSSIGLVARLMRGGYPKELMDAMGEESVGMSLPPEMSTAFLPWAMKKLARIYGYSEAMDCPREWKSRYYPYRFAKDKTPAAGLLVRDALIAHALGYSVIPVGASTETGNSYADSIWCSGTFSRWPLAYPRKAAAAVATLTQLLDCAGEVRLVPTGSLTVYALEFSVNDDYVYAIWDSRGETHVMPKASRLGVSHEVAGDVVEITGRVKPYRGGTKIAVGEEPVYFCTETRLDGFAADLVRTFPRERFPGMEKAVTAHPLDSDGDVELCLTADPRVEVPFADTPRRVGAFTLEAVTDEQQGTCLELTHDSKEACPEMVLEYATLRIKDPKPVMGEFANIGVWVKGNSNWGRVFLEFKDAEGETWFSCGEGGVGCDVYDWPMRMSMNYDGWNFLQLPLCHGSPVKNPSPGDNEFQWTRDGTGNGRIDFPITVTAITIGQTGRTLDLLEMKSGSPKVRIGPVKLW